MENWKAIARTKAARSGQLVEPRVGQWRSVVGMVYRYDEAALRDWSKQIGQSRLQLLPPAVNRQRDAVLRLQVEYLAKCMPAGKVLSLANAVEAGDVGQEAEQCVGEANFSWWWTSIQLGKS